LNVAKGIDDQKHAELKEASRTLQLIYGYLEMGYTLSYSADGGEAKEIGNVSTLDLSDEHFVGPIIGIFAEGEGGEIGSRDLTIDSASYRTV
jgi:hypothetical protein